MINQVVRAENDEVVQDFIKPYAWIVHEDGSQGIEELDYDVKEVFVPFEVCWELGLPRQRQIRVSFAFIQEVMVVWVIPSKRNGTGDPHGDITHDSQNFVDSHVGVSAPMREIMDAAVECMIKEASDQIGI